MEFDVQDFIDSTLKELSMRGNSLLSRATTEDAPVIERTTRALLQAYWTNLASPGHKEATEEFEHLTATLRDIALRYEIDARVEISNAVNAFIGRATNFLLAALIK